VFGWNVWHTIVERTPSTYTLACGTELKHDEVEGATKLSTFSRRCTNCEYPGRLKDRRAMEEG
jgi:hypothetical protein